jgi:two-component system chemotaxis response regulator CheB
MDKPIRILVIDDSAYNRQTITAMLEGTPEFAVIGRAADGEEGLRLAFTLNPDVITLDLEMPKMDGFKFLRLLMSKQPTPVIVISGYATRENVFKALELGALDFVAKPSRTITPDLRNIKEELLHKVRLVTQLRMVSLSDRAARSLKVGTTSGQFNLPPPAPPTPRKEGPAPPRLVAIGASTGGPPAISRVLCHVDATLPLGVVVTQHMPVKFTKAFAERLDRTTPWNVREAEPGDVLTAGTVLVAPGGASIGMRLENGSLKIDLVGQRAEDRYVPSVDHMLISAAQAMGNNLMAVVLTGMGGDGGRGVRAVKAQGGRVIAEAPETAVIFGMPQEAIATGAVDEIAPLGSIAELIMRFGREARTWTPLDNS